MRIVSAAGQPLQVRLTRVILSMGDYKPPKSRHDGPMREGEGS
jgi:hypothetical protein